MNNYSGAFTGSPQNFNGSFGNGFNQGGFSAANGQSFGSVSGTGSGGILSVISSFLQAIQSVLFAITNIQSIFGGQLSQLNNFSNGLNGFNNNLNTSNNFGASSFGGNFSAVPGNSAASDFINNKIGSRGSTGDCAMYGRQLVGAITGNSYFSQGLGIIDSDRPYASNGGAYLLGSGQYAQVSDTGSYQNGDTRIYTGGQGGKGHWETFYEGRWYSDHAQTRAYTDKIGSYYSGASLYRIKG